MTSRIVFLFLFIFSFQQVHGPHGGTALAQDNFIPFVAESTSDQVNVRAGQSANFERLSQLQKGEEVVVVDKEYSWYKIQLPLSAKSFISKDYVQFLGLNAGGVVASGVNIRAGAGIEYTILGQASKGQQIYIQEELDDWYRIEPVAESFGWVSEKFLAMKSQDISSHQTVSFKQFTDEQNVQAESITREQQRFENTPVDESEPLIAKKKGISSFIGTVETHDNGGTDGIYYKIVSGKQTICYIQGVNYMLGRFVNHQVSVDGTVNQKLLSQYSHPVINVLKVRLIL